MFLHADHGIFVWAIKSRCRNVVSCARRTVPERICSVMHRRVVHRAYHGRIIIIIILFYFLHHGRTFGTMTGRLIALAQSVSHVDERIISLSKRLGARTCHHCCWPSSSSSSSLLFSRFSSHKKSPTSVSDSTFSVIAFFIDNLMRA